MKYIFCLAILLSFSANASFITFDQSDIEGHGNQATSGGFNVFGGGTGLEVFGNYWASLQNISIADINNSVMSFEFMTTSVGEINGIGFDNDGEISTGGLVFNLGGTQNFGNDDFAVTLDPNVWYTFTIDFTAYDLSSFDRILFIADNDADGEVTDSFFRNIIVSNASVSVPSPSTFAIFSIALLGLCFRQRMVK